MEERSKFQFLGFKIIKSYIEVKQIDKSQLDIDIDLSGSIDNSKGFFLLTMGVKVFNDEKSINVEVVSTGEYKFSPEQEKEELKGFMFLNAPAILFPYIRAYVSTLTSLSGINPINLPTMNLSILKPMLEKNTVTIE